MLSMNRLLQLFQLGWFLLALCLCFGLLRGYFVRRRLLLVLLAVLAPILLMSHNVSAYELGGTSQVIINTMTGTSQAGGSPAAQYTTDYYQLDFASGQTLTTTFNLSASIPAHSIFSLSYQVQFAGTNTTGYMGINCSTVCVILANEESLDDDVVVGHALIYVNQSTSSFTLNTIFRANASVIWKWHRKINYALIPYPSTPEDYSGDLEALGDYLRSIDANQLISAQRLAQLLEAINKLSNTATSADIQEMVDATNRTNDLIEKQQEKEQEAEDNISAQTPDDMEGTENAQSSSLIGIIGDFIASLSASSGSCQLNMPLPSFIGGNTSVNVCQGKDSFGNVIEVASSIALIVFYLPLAFVMLRMIYNEIRSFTNANG